MAFNTPDFDLPIIHKVYDFYNLFYRYLETFPKKDKYILGQKCENIILDILELIFTAAQTKQENKLDLLEKASVKLNILRIIVRLAKDIKVLDFKKYLTIQKNIDEIGRMLGGWIKLTKDR
ncbi:MAG: diversity-generating retroelement protein Avd [Candidatus Pacebacteria bacterium]|nr:diversity-generating retroelement protein Avd [Candidatus Paceibacterota bacterium]